MNGTRLGSWVIDRELGSGGMGRVYLAHREPAGLPGPQQAAVKVLAAELATEAGFLERFQREIETLRQLSHPNIVAFYEAGLEEGRYWYAMEYVAGRNLEELLQEQGRLPWKDVLHLALQVAPALKHAHDRGIIHRDLKPNNLLRADDGTVKLADFGIAKVFASRQLTATGGLVGTAEYLSPEQAAGKPVSPRSDLYSLGAVLYTLLVGRTPFQGNSVVELLHKHRFGQFDRPQRRVPGIPYEIDEVVCQLLEKDPGHRPANAMILYQQLDRIGRKLERKEEPTIIVAPAGSSPPEASGTALDPQSAAGPATLMSRLMREELNRENRGGPVARFFNRPLVLVVLLAACIGIMVWRLWPHSEPPAEVLFQRGSQLMASDNPRDWEKAWQDYLEPLNRKYPHHPYQKEVEAYRQRKDDGEALLKAVAALQAAGPASDAQRFYQRGLEYCRQGDLVQARWTWRNVVRAFGGIESERRWVQLAQEGLTLLHSKALAGHPEDDSLQQAVKQVQRLRREGKAKEAEEVRQAIDALYGQDPAAHDLLQKARKDLGH